MMLDPNVSGWRPNFLPADEQFQRQAQRLGDLVSDQVAETWVVWNLDFDEWFADLPVVLRLASGRQLEVCWEKFDDCSITWNTIDLTETPRGWVEWPLRWRRAAHAALEAIEHETIREVRTTTFEFTTHSVTGPCGSASTWLTTGVWLGTGTGGLHVFNALDENGVSGQRPVEDAAHRSQIIATDDGQAPGSSPADCPH
ncbi:hypothetical protein [Promicromonospora sp. NPDC059942]|uniref:hypothetical protein n=1 Tax=Promicromonospora sp. NPDC059942 TaxID=3347009 RepID=UPI0036614F86